MVCEWTVENFRGISEPVTINLQAKGTGKVTSLVLLGDNGSGKSSLVDALEFCLRGRLSRRSGAEGKQRREVMNLSAGRKPPAVITSLSDGQSFKRGGGLRDFGPRPIGQAKMVPEFSVAPIIVRRHDVESFWLISPEERQKFFFDYLRSDYRAIVRPDRRATLLEAHKAASVRLAEANKRMIEVSDVPETKLPTNLRTARIFLERTLRGKNARKGAMPRTLAPGVQAAYDELVAAIDEKNQLDGRVRVLSTDSSDDAKIQPVLSRISDRITENFTKVARLDWVDNVNLNIGEGQEFSITLDLAGGQTVEPIQVLSEAALDLLALLIIIEVHTECVELGQSPLIVLDDVFQSVDATHRVHAMDHILVRLSGWQVIVTVHDRLWMELVCASLRRASHSYKALEVLAGSFGSSPRIRGADVDHSATLREVLSRSSNPSLVAAAAGRLLEELSDKLSVSLECSVPRRADDKYDLGALWPGVLKSLKRNGTTEMGEAALEVNRLLELRNILGAHYNEWAIAVSTQEATEFGSAVLRLWELATCPSCGARYAKYRPLGGGKEMFAVACKCADTTTNA